MNKRSRDQTLAGNGVHLASHKQNRILSRQPSHPNSHSFQRQPLCRLESPLANGFPGTLQLHDPSMPPPRPLQAQPETPPLSRAVAPPDGAENYHLVCRRPNSVITVVLAAFLSSDIARVLRCSHGSCSYMYLSNCWIRKGAREEPGTGSRILHRADAVRA
jgi:hypothetical protein